jgi:hypothetical protein
VVLVGGASEDILLRCESVLALGLDLRLAQASGGPIDVGLVQRLWDRGVAIGLRVGILPLFVAFETVTSAAHDDLLTHGHLILFPFFNYNSGLSVVLDCSNLLGLGLFDRFITGDRASLLPDNPVIIIVIVKSLFLTQILKQLPQVVVIWLLLEFKVPAVVQVF